MDGQPVVLLTVLVSDRLVIDVLAGVIADRTGGGGRLDADAEVALVGAEHYTVEVVDPVAVETAGLDDLVHRVDEVGHGPEPEVTQRDERLDRLQLDLQSNRIAKCAIGIREGPEKVAVLVGGGPDDLAGPGEDVHLQDGLMGGQPVAERRRLDPPQPGDRAPPERDGLELRHHQRRQAVGQCGGDQILVGAHARHVGRARVRVDRDDIRQPPRGVQPPRPAVLRPGAKQVRRRLGEPDRGIGRDGPVTGEKPLHAVGVSGPCVG